MSIREKMPALVKHEGDWKGKYVLVDDQANILDQYDSLLSCSFPTDGSSDYFQINRYAWADGKTEEHRFPGQYRDGRVYFDSDRIYGYCWEVDDLTVILTWHYKSDPDQNWLYEMIQISKDGQHRARTWHWFENGELVKRTLIKEKRVK
jgi:hypothetical protein